MTEAEWLKTFGDNLAFYLRESGMSQRDLATLTGLSESAISNYVNKGRTPTIRAALNIAYAFGVDVKELIDFGGTIG